MPSDRATSGPDTASESGGLISTTAGQLSLLALTGLGLAAMAVGGRYIKPAMKIDSLLKPLVSAASADSLAATELIQGGARVPGLTDYLGSLSADQRRGLVFERFLARTPKLGDQPEYALQGSFRLKLTGHTKRVPDDVDFIRVDPDMSLSHSTRKVTSDALLSELKSTFGRDVGDGFSFDVPRIITRPAYWAYPAMRQAEVIAKANGQEVMRFSTGVRMQPRTILPTEQLKLPSIEGLPPLEASVLAKEEILGRKLFSIQKSLVATRGPKDIYDVAHMIRQGVDEHKVESTMRAFYGRGFSLSPMSERAPWSMRLLQGTSRMKGQTAEEFQRNYETISQYFNNRVMPKLADDLDLSDVRTDIASRLKRALFSRTAYFVW